MTTQDEPTSSAPADHALDGLDVPPDLVAGASPEGERALTEVYLEALRHPGVTRSLLSQRGFSLATIDAATTLLQGAGMLRATGVDGTWEALPPDLTLPVYAHGLEQRAASARALAGDLTRVFYRAREQGSDASGTTEVHVLTSLQDVQDATDRLMASAEATVRTMRDASPRTAYLFASDLDTHRTRALNGEGVPLTRLVTYDTAILDLPRAGDVLLARQDGGEDQRFFSGVPFTVLVADASVALVDVTSFDSSGHGCLVVRDRRIVLALTALCDLMFSLGSSVATTAETSLDARSAFILTLLASGATDATIAAQTDVSQRTVERTVRSLMHQLGAVTRFQAGVQAARRGWL